jgi:hypothetical protein
MPEVHIGVVRVGDNWTIVGNALRTRDYETRLQAVSAAHRFAAGVIGRCVLLHIQDDGLELKPGKVVG